MQYSPAAALYAAEKTNQGAKSAGELVLMLIALIAILIATYFITKYVAKLMQRGTLPIPGGKKSGAAVRFRGGARRSGEYLELLDTVMLDRERAVTAVRSGEKVYILGFTQGSCTLIDTLDYVAPENDECEAAPQKQDFVSMFKQYSGWGGKGGKDEGSDKK